MIARVARIRCNDNEDIGQYWRRLHRSCHDLLQLYGGSPNWRRSRTLHRFAGHLARSMDATLSAALHTRCIAWWRYRQERHLVMHPRRFKTWRWESQLADYYGEAQSQSTRTQMLAGCCKRSSASSGGRWKMSSQFSIACSVCIVTCSRGYRRLVRHLL